MANNAGYSAILSIRAEKELITSFDWYENQQTGLGDRFIATVLLRIGIITQTPETFSPKFKSYRETAVAPFPFIIIYRINKRKKIVRIVSVFHTSQDPRKKYI